MLVGTLGESLFGNLSTGKGRNKKDQGIVKAGYGNNQLDF